VEPCRPQRCTTRGRQLMLCDVHLMHDFIVGRLACRATGTTTEIHGTDQGSLTVLVELSAGGRRSKRLVDGKVTGNDCVSGERSANERPNQRWCHNAYMHVS